MTDKPSFQARENGPMVVKGLDNMTGVDGNTVDVKPVVALCRCGASKSKPFCDGSHTDIGFESNGGKPAGRDRLIDYEGSDVTVTFNPVLCSHAGQCGKLARHVFNTKERPWIRPDEGTRSEIEEVVAACPSGALSLSGEHKLMQRATVTVEPNGPYWVQFAEIEADAPGEGASEDKFVLCRCGLSGNKPYCDGTHYDQGWKSED